MLAELTEVLLASPSGAHTERGFSMCLDGALEARAGIHGEASVQRDVIDYVDYTGRLAAVN